MAIYRKLLEIQSAIKGLTKDKAVFNYDYVTGDKLLSHIRPMMCDKQLLLLPSVFDVKSQVVTYEVYDRNAKSFVNKTEILYVVMLEMKWVDAEDGEVLVEKWSGSGMNAFDKGYGSALTYGERYYLLKTFHIPTDKDDVDAIAATRDKELEATYAAKAQQSKIQEQPAAPQPAAPQPKPIDIDTLNKYIVGHAEGKKTKSGKTFREGYISAFCPTPEMIASFDEAVAEYKVNNNML